MVSSQSTVTRPSTNQGEVIHNADFINGIGQKAKNSS
jgi:hypothetical protein